MNSYFGLSCSFFCYQGKISACSCLLGGCLESDHLWSRVVTVNQSIFIIIVQDPLDLATWFKCYDFSACVEQKNTNYRPF